MSDKAKKAAADPIPDGRVRVTVTMNGYACPEFSSKRYDLTADLTGDAAEELVGFLADLRRRGREAKG